MFEILFRMYRISYNERVIGIGHDKAKVKADLLLDNLLFKYINEIIEINKI